MKKIKIRRNYQCLNSKEADVIKESYKLIKAGNLNKCKSLLKDIPLENIMVELTECGVLNTHTLKMVRKIIIICKEMYSNNNTIMSDIIYDPLLNKYKCYEAEPIVENFKLSRRTVDVDHMYPELKGTLDKANTIYNKDKIVDLDKPLEKFIEKLFEVNTNDTINTIVTRKFDGVSLVADIVDANINMVLSRGEDNKGIDLTHLFKHIKFDKHKDKSGVKFECVMTKENFKKYCEDIGKKYANLRTAVVSIITRTKDTKFSKYLSLVPLQATDVNVRDYDKLNYLYANDVINEPWILKSKSVLEAINKINYIIVTNNEYKDNLDYAIDGLVIDCIDNNVRNTLGRSNDINRYQIAYKFEAEERWTHVKYVSSNTGRTGLVTPMVHYDEIDFNGGKHTKSSLSSFKRFKTLNLKANDVIRVTYNADVMPYVSKPDNMPENINNTNCELDFPTHCTSCGSKLKLTGANYYCTNDKTCPAKNIAKYEHFYKKLGIRDISEKTVAKMIAVKAISDYDSLLDIDYKILLNTDGFGFGKATNYKQQIFKLKKKEIDEAKLVAALGVCGESNCRKILSHIDILKVLSNPDKLYSISIEGIEVITKKSFINGITSVASSIKHYMNELNVVPVKYNKSKMSVCFTGFRDKELTEMLSMIDIEVVNYKKSISYLVVKDIDDTNSKGKIDKAIQAGIPVITKTDFAKLIREEYM